MALFCQRPAQTLLSGALMNPQYAAKAAKSVFKHVLLLSFFAAVMMRTRYVAPLLIFALVVVLWDLYLRLNNLKNPLPTWRELLKNTRQGMTDFVVQMKQAASATQKHTVSKRKVVSSKKPKKAPLKKKPIHKRKKKK